MNDEKATFNEEQKGKEEKPKKKKYEKHVLGFGIMGFTDAGVYDFFCDFGMFFLTAIASIPSGIAGALISAGTLINAIMNPIIGYISDHLSSKTGRRRILIIIGGIGSCVALPLMLIPLPDWGAFKIIYCGILVIGFWISYALFYPPFLAYGADISESYDGRSSLRALVTFCNNTGTLAVTVLTTTGIAILTGMHMSEQMAWFVAAVIIAGLCLVTLIPGWKMTAGHDIVIEKVKIEILPYIKNMLVAYMSSLKMRPLRLIIYISLITVTGYTIKASATMFLYKYVAGLSAATIAFVYAYGAVLSLFRPIITKWFCDWFQKKGAFIVCTALFVIPSVYYYFAGFNGLTDIIIYVTLVGFILSGYWQLIPAMIYDLSEVDMFFNKQKREGTLVSLQALSESVAGAAGAAILGLLLDHYGYVGGGVQQTAESLNGILMLNTIIPSIFFVVACIFIFVFPITRERHAKLKEAVEKGIRYENLGEHEEYADLRKLK